MTRLAALQERLADGALAIVGPTDSMRYLTGHRPTAHERLTALLVTAGDAVAVVPRFDVVRFEEAGLGVVLGWRDDTGPAGAVAEALTRLGGAPPLERWLVDDELPAAMLLALTGRRAGALASLSPVLAPLRSRKDAREAAAMRAAGELVSETVSAVAGLLREGVTEAQLARALARRLLDAGAESVDGMLVQAGPNAAVPHHRFGERPIRRGEPVQVDLFAALDGYWGDITRSFCIGEPSEAYREAHALAQAAHDAAWAAIARGVELGALARAANDVLAAGGAPREGRIGHGLGVSIHEPPALDEAAAEPIAPGLAFTIEPGVYRLGELGVRVEDSVLIDATGRPERLTSGPHELVVV